MKIVLHIKNIVKIVILKDKKYIKFEYFFKNNKKMLLFIKTLTSTIPSFYIEIDEKNTILKLKEKINKEKKIEIRDQVLLYAGYRLEDDKTFKDYNITKNEPLIIMRIMKNIQ